MTYSEREREFTFANNTRNSLPNRHSICTLDTVIIFKQYTHTHFVYVTTGVDLAGIPRGTHGKGRSWVGAEWGRVWGVVSSLQLTRGSGERHELPQRGPGPKQILPYFEGHRTLLFVLITTKSEGDNLHYRPLLQILGDAPPVIYAHDCHSIFKYFSCCCCCRMHYALQQRTAVFHYALLLGGRGRATLTFPSIGTTTPTEQHNVL